ncbi:MAG: hypothetical protein HW405_141 [Candidatus Berkelbacteria bacterium]|nr:hypothetical protein [Candidatus Berkelbacteria bacterium]
MKDTEVEIQVKIAKVEPLLKLLEKEGKFLYEEKQIDQYFTPTHRDFKAKKPIEEWLRLRNSNGKYSITYKNWYRSKDKKTHHCDEYESNLEKIDQLEKIFNVLNFKTVVKVEKTRRAYLFKEYEIAIDKVRGLGDFVELEYKSKIQKKPGVITTEMVEFLKSLNLGKISRNYVGYAYKCLYPNDDHLEEDL